MFDEIPVALPLVVGLVLPLAGLASLFVSARCVRRHEHLRKRRFWLIVLGIVLGFPLSYVRWPIDHPLTGRPSLRLRFFGFPAPIGGSFHVEGRSAIQPAFVYTAYLQNGFFAAGLLQALLLLGHRRGRHAS